MQSAQNAHRNSGVHYGGGKHAILLNHPQIFGKVTDTMHRLVLNSLSFLVSPDRSRTLNSLQSGHRPRQNLHPYPLPKNFPEPSSAHCPLDRRRLRTLLLHRPILRTANPMSTH